LFLGLRRRLTDAQDGLRPHEDALVEEPVAVA
jgi:hypothetical protein